MRLDDHPIPKRHGDYLWIDLSHGLDEAGRDQLWRAITHTALLGPRVGVAPGGRVFSRRKRWSACRVPNAPPALGTMIPGGWTGGRGGDDGRD